MPHTGWIDDLPDHGTRTRDERVMVENPVDVVGTTTSKSTTKRPVHRMMYG